MSRVVRNAIHRARGQRGQAATEYMMVVSVLVIAVVGAAWVFVPSFHNGVYDLSNDVSLLLSQNGSAKGGYGLAANNASGGGYDPTAAQAPMAQSAQNSGYDPGADAGE